MAELIAIGYPEEATAQQARDEVGQQLDRPDTARAIIRNCEGSIWVATNPYGLAVGITLVMLVNKEITDTVAEALSRHGGTILESSLSADAEWRLQEALLGPTTS
jgi:uncharacterized membrane protein